LRSVVELFITKVYVVVMCLNDSANDVFFIWLLVE